MNRNDAKSTFKLFRSGKWQISANCGDYPVWSHDGRELYYISADRKITAIETRRDGKHLVPSAPTALFDVQAVATFDVSEDGRFLIQVPVEHESPDALTVIANWQTMLKK
jgi:hypothetical protein